MLHKSKLLSVFLLSSIAMSASYASAATTAPLATEEEASAAQAASPAEVTKVNITGGAYVRSPIRRGERHHSLIALTNCSSIGELDTTCFMNDPHLAIVSFKGSNINFTGFKGGLFGKNCAQIRTLDFTGTRGVTLKEFVEELAAPDLLDLILRGTCTLKIDCAPEDISARGAPEARPQIYDQSQIQTMIRAFRDIRTASAEGGTVWWVLSKLTLGLVAEK